MRFDKLGFVVLLLALLILLPCVAFGPSLIVPDVSGVSLAGISFFSSLGNAIKKGFTSTAGKAILGTVVAAGATAALARLGGSGGQPTPTEAQRYDELAAQAARRGTAAQFFSSPLGVGALVGGAILLVMVLRK